MDYHFRSLHYKENVYYYNILKNNLAITFHMGSGYVYLNYRGPEGKIYNGTFSYTNYTGSEEYLDHFLIFYPDRVEGKGGAKGQDLHFDTSGLLEE